MLADATVAAPPVALELDLDVFDGPFDLLVTLILKDEIDIWEVRVSRIIAEYVLKLADSGEFDLDATSQFAALLEMKSRLLLEEDVEEELEDLDPDEAAERLLDILLQKQARFHLEQRRDQHHELRGRVEVELAAVRKLQDVLGDDARHAHLPDVDLVLEDQRDEQVERPVEHVEVELERDGRCGDGGVSEHRRRLLKKSSAA